MSQTLRRIFRIILHTVLVSIKEILAVQFHKGEYSKYQISKVHVLLFYLYVAFHIIPYLCEIGFHAFRVFVIDDLQEFLQLRSYLCHLTACVGVEEDFLQQVVIFVQHSLGNPHVSFERCSRCILVFHHGSEHKSRYKRD